VPGFINLLPKELSKPKRSGPEEVIPVPRSALPDFGTPAHLMPDDFWSNLKQFLTERPVKIVERSDVPFTKNSFGTGLGENLKFFLYGPKARKGPIIAIALVLCAVFVPIMLICGIRVVRFLRAIREPALTAFSTASSESALPLALENLELMGVPKHIVAFVLPTGYSFNLDGSTLYLALASIFVAQAAGIHLSFPEQLIMVFTLMLTSKGVAGVPRATLVILLATADSFHLPVWPILVILGVDQLMDMARTMVNVIGNCLASAVIARWEGELNTEAPAPVL